MIVKQLIRKALAIPAQTYNRAVLARRHVQYGRNLKINGRIYCVANTAGGIQIGDNVRINSSLGSNPIGGATRTILFARPCARISIGSGVGISNSTLFAAENITVEDNVLIGGDCCIYDTDFHSVDYENRIHGHDTEAKSKPVTIKEGAFIGAHSIILKGVTVGRHSVVAAGSVVPKSIPDNELWGGQPAKFIKKINIS